jgi:polyhydroxybutyrate depolymerase
VMHGREDRVFPGWGRQAAAWWASCNRCSAALPARPLGDGCVEFQDCTAGGRTLYCEGGGDHRTWPGLGEQIVRFFAHE